MAWYPASTGALPSQMGYYPGPNPPKGDEIVKTDIGDVLRQHVKSVVLTPALTFMLVGTLLLSMLSLVPIWNALCLLWDPNYIFWAGSKIPECMIVFCIIIVLLYPITVFGVFSRAGALVRTEQTIMMIASVFITLFGLFLMMVSLPLTQSAQQTYTNLLYRCDFAEETHRLYEYSHVLQNVRAQPECATKFSVVDCIGYQDAPPYTNMLKSMENHFRCAGFCYKRQFATNSSAAATVSALSVKQELRMLHRSDSEAQQHSLAADADMNSLAGNGEVAMFPPTLFSDANFQASCEGMAAREMQNVAGDIGEQTFFQGLYLVLIAVITGFLKLFGVFFRKS